MPHVEYLARLVDLDGMHVVDIGAGKGHFANQLHQRGATVTGVEVEAAKVAEAQRKAAPGVTMIEGRGEALPLDDDCQDLACFIYSLHHVPRSSHAAALTEVSRVLKPGGRLHIVEPLPEACADDPMRFIDDETEVLTASHALIATLPETGHFRLIDTSDYAVLYAYPSFEKFLSSIVGVDPDRAAKLPAARHRMEREFHDKAEMRDGAYNFCSPCRAFHFEFVS
jgi:ubiquinone/menaquinone biosynthesis C-methylase UbiE